MEVISKLMGGIQEYSSVRYNLSQLGMTPERKIRTPVIKNYIAQEFIKAPISAEFQSLYHEKLSVLVLEKEDKNLMYVTDGCNTILAISIRKKKQEGLLNPYWPKGQRPLFYKANINTYRYLNFTKDYPLLPEWTQAIDPNGPSQPTQPVESKHEPSFKDKHPYNPYFHFDEQSFKVFLAQRSSYKCPATIIHFTKWQLGLVNIKDTGYYAPVIVFHQLIRGSERDLPLPDYLSLNCILFEQSVQEHMEQYRINDIRQSYQKQNPKAPFRSLFYKARHLTLSSGNKQNSLMVQIDNSQAMINHNKAKQVNYVLTSDCLEGVCSITNISTLAINSQAAEIIQAKNFMGLFNGLELSPQKIALLEEKKMVIEEVKQMSGQLWSDSESEEFDKTDKIKVEYYDSSEEEEEDPLTALYKKRYAQKK